MIDKGLIDKIKENNTVMESKDKEISKLKKLLKTKIKELTEIQKIKEQTNPFAINTPKK